MPITQDLVMWLKEHIMVNKACCKLDIVSNHLKSKADDRSYKVRVYPLNPILIVKCRLMRQHSIEKQVFMLDLY